MDYHIVLRSDIFGRQSDALFHLEESYTLATGKIDGVKWECRLANCGEQRLYDKKGDRIANDELRFMYETDEALSQAIDTEEITIGNNSWWELEFFYDDGGTLHWLDLFPDNSEVIDSPQDAIMYFIQLMDDEEFTKELTDALHESNKELVGAQAGVIDALEKEVERLKEELNGKQEGSTM